MTLTEQEMDIPQAWQQLNLDRLRGPVMVIGAPDVGKSVFARYLYHRLMAASRRAAYLDGDPGQSTLGPPTTMTVAIGAINEAETFPPPDQCWRSFVGATSPRGHMLPLVIGAARLVGAAHRAGAEIIIYDTCGLVDPAHGGTALKLAKIDLLQPVWIYAIQSRGELEALLTPLRRRRRLRVVELRPSPAVRPRDIAARQAHRAGQFARYFNAARPLRVVWPRLAVFPGPGFFPNRLVALEDERGLTLGLGLVKDSDRQTRQVTLHTPLASLAEVDALRLGDLTLDPETFREQRLGRD
jgi:polynucleotide 5'-hydroxyl-kinase GRC3/NOL9